VISTKLRAVIEAGMSQREAAKALGVDESTVWADLRENPVQDAEKSRTKAERRAQRELELASKQADGVAERGGRAPGGGHPFLRTTQPPLCLPWPIFHLRRSRIFLI
jgi:DNA-binding XRE family transcriptional regulator